MKSIKIGGLYQTFNLKGGHIAAYPKVDGFAFQMLNKGIPLIVIEQSYTSNPDQQMFICLIGDKLYSISQECIGELNV
jgi:hypothetical protein